MGRKFSDWKVGEGAITSLLSPSVTQGPEKRVKSEKKNHVFFDPKMPPPLPPLQGLPPEWPPGPGPFPRWAWGHSPFQCPVSPQMKQEPFFPPLGLKPLVLDCPFRPPLNFPPLDLPPFPPLPLFYISHLLFGSISNH